MKKRRFVILDRDGTVIEECYYLSDPERVKLIPGVAEALGQIRLLGLGIIMVTNQSAVGRGFFDMARLHAIHAKVEFLLQNEGIHLDGIYVCTHTPEDRCRCRKPETGLAERAVQDFGFDPEASFVIGDKDIDIEFGKRSGATAILVRTGYGTETEKKAVASPDYIVDDLSGAVSIIRKIISV